MSVPVRRSPNDTRDAEAGPTGSRLRVSLSPQTRRRLVRLLVAKAALDLLFVTTLAFGTGHLPLRTRFGGTVDQAGPRAVRGRLTDASGQGRPVEVQLFLDGRFAASALVEAGEREGERPFVFDLDPPRDGAREALVFAVEPSRDGSRRTLHPLGGPAPLAEK